MRTIIFFLFLALNLSNQACADLPPDNKDLGAAWSYAGTTGPKHWGNLDRNYQLCTVGKHQSPVDIKNAVPEKGQNTLYFKYHVAPLYIIGEGLTQLNLSGHETLVNTGHTIQLNFPEEYTKEIMLLSGDKYRLLQFHFHIPAEHLVNGKRFPMEIHFVHQNKIDELVFVSVFAKEGEPNSILQTIVDNLPKKTGQLQVTPDISIDPEKLVPNNLSYFTYTGSLPIPPCSENVTWIIMKNPIEVSAAQIQRLHNALKENNARPIQPLNNRVIYEFNSIHEKQS